MTVSVVERGQAIYRSTDGIFAPRGIGESGKLIAGRSSSNEA